MTLPSKPSPPHTALLLLGLQNDLASLNAIESQHAIDAALALNSSIHYSTIISVQECFPKDHISFIETHALNSKLPLRVGDSIALNDGTSQQSRSRRCVSGTKGAQLLESIAQQLKPQYHLTIGETSHCDTYSAFHDKGSERDASPLSQLLSQRHVTQLHVCGLATRELLHTVQYALQQHRPALNGVTVVRDASVLSTSDLTQLEQLNDNRRLMIQTSAELIASITAQHSHDNKSADSSVTKRDDSASPTTATTTASSTKNESLDAYMQRHALPQLFESLVGQLIYQKPAEPRTFLIQQLKQLQQSKGGKPAPALAPASLFTDSDLDILFSLQDVMKKGEISLLQARQALQQLGVEESHADAQLHAKSYKVDGFRKIARQAMQLSS